MKKVLGCVIAAALMLMNLAVYAADFAIRYDEAAASGDLYEYLGGVLSETDIYGLSASDLSAIADYIEYAAGLAAVSEIPAQDNAVSVDGNYVKEKEIVYAEETRRYTELLRAYGISLNREIRTEVPVIITGAQLSSFADITITNENLSAMADIGRVKLIFEGNNEYISLSGENIRAVYDRYRQFHIQIRELSGTYSVRFLDGNGSIISRYCTDIEIGLPSDGPENTAYIFYDNHQENWGGQYDAGEGLIELMTAYSGEYSVSEPDIEISDIDGLSDYEKEIVRFMTVRQYFELENGRFNPDATLSRYQFTQALVRMMFALDDGAECTFSDVNAENYRYIAASEKKSIVEGFEDGTFRGDEAVTGEQVIALASRTINEKNGYLYPDNTDKYLNFAGQDSIADWAEKEVALAVREGIYTPEIGLNFKAPISRSDAAVMLYRLFMILNNTPPVSVSGSVRNSMASAHKSFWTPKNAAAVVAVVVLIDAAAAVSAAVVVRKKKKRGISS